MDNIVELRQLQFDTFNLIFQLLNLEIKYCKIVNIIPLLDIITELHEVKNNANTLLLKINNQINENDKSISDIIDNRVKPKSNSLSLMILFALSKETSYITIPDIVHILFNESHGKNTAENRNKLEIKIQSTIRKLVKTKQIVEYFDRINTKYGSERRCKGYKLKIK